jgi:hypothetical protein
MYKKFDGWFIEATPLKTLKGYRRATIKDMKQGAFYYWRSSLSGKITHRLQFDIVTPKYIGDLRKQMEKDFIWVKDVQPKKEVKEDNSQMSMF